MTAIWHRLPVAVRAVNRGIPGAAGRQSAVGRPRHGQRPLNPSFPWAALVMACYIWLLWRWLGGRGRRGHLRANPLRGRVWGWSLLAGASGLLALVELLSVLGRL